MRPRQTDHEAGDPGKRWEASLQTELYSQKMAHDFLSGSEAMFPPPPYCCLFILEDWDLFQILITRGLSLQAELPHTQSHTQFGHHFRGHCCSPSGLEETSSDQLIAH